MTTNAGATETPVLCATVDIMKNELKSAVHAMQPHKAPGFDGIQSVLLGEVFDNISSRLLEVFNASLRNGHYPAVWKTAVVVILRKPKRSDYSSCKAHRRIALLPVLGKILVSIFPKSLNYVAETSCWISALPFGFRSHHRASDAVLNVVEIVKPSFHKRCGLTPLTRAWKEHTTMCQCNYLETA